MMIALSGEVPASLARRLTASKSYADFAVKRLKHDGLIRTYSHNGLRGLRLTSSAKKMLIANQPDRFLPLFTGDTITNAPKYAIAHRLRLHRMAEVLVSMFNAGVSVLPWEKPAVFTPTLPDTEPNIERPTYYSSREVKDMGLIGNKIRNSRAIGVLLASGDIFVVYNTSPSEMAWKYKVELRLKSLLQTELSTHRLPTRFMHAKQSGILFAANMLLLPSLLEADNDDRLGSPLTSNTFQDFYCLTSDHHGEVILQILCDPDKRAALDCILSEDLDPPRPGFVVENDAMDGDAPVLFAYTCDMPRIKHFDTALSLHELTGVLYCFDFQEEAMRQICGPNVRIKCIDFDVYEGSVFHSTQETD